MSDTLWTSGTARLGTFAHDRNARTAGRLATDGQPEGTDGTGQGAESGTGPGTLVFADPASRALERLLARVAPSDVPIMISGDAGTGKGALAREIHSLSGRSGAFVCVNCSAVAAQLAEGSSNAIATSNASADPVRSERWFEEAHLGTLFLDEVAALPAILQGQLLRVLQDREAARVEVPDTVPADVRLVAATTVDLSETISAGRFRLDLFYRLNVGKVRLLPLRQRRSDVAALANHFLGIHAARLNLPRPLLSQQTLEALTQYSWPGNIRELENVIRFALLVAPEKELRVEHLKLEEVSQHTPAPQAVRILPTEAGAHSGSTASRQVLSQWLTPLFQTPGERLLSELESQIVDAAFRFTGRNQVQTAALLGISRNVLRTLLRKHGLFAIRRRSAPAAAGSKR